MYASSVGGTDQANHTIQSTLSASVFQIAISEIKRVREIKEAIFKCG